MFRIPVTVFLSAFLVVGPSSCATVERSAAISEAGRREEAFPYPVLVLEGDAAAIGKAHGQRLGNEIRALHSKYFESYFRSPWQRTLALTTAGVFEMHLLPEHRDEIQALAGAAEVEERQMMLAQCFLDLSAMSACSTITLPTAAAPDGIARFGRNLEFPSFNVADKSTVVLAYRPAGKNAFVSIAWPGLIGVLSGMNEHGLCIANMEVHRTMRVPVAMPYTLLYRAVLEQCRTTDEAVAFLEKTPRQSANNLMVMDAAGNRAVVEITPEGVHVRRGIASEALISTNHQRDQDSGSLGRCDRYDMLKKESTEEFGEIDLKMLRSMLKDVSVEEMTIQSMVFEPANRIIFLSAGSNAAAGPFSRLDVGKLLAAK